LRLAAANGIRGQTTLAYQIPTKKLKSPKTPTVSRQG
jgi:hypothetical protein